MPVLAQTAAPPRLPRVPAFPPAALKLLGLLQDDNSTIAEIAACIALEPTFTSRILKRANAADCVRFGESRNVAEAIVALGLRRTAEVVFTTATMACFGSLAQSESQRRCWRHTVACATLAAGISTECGCGPSDAYTAGLLHDIGRLGLLSAYGKEYEAAMTNPAALSAEYLDFERERFGWAHTDVGAHLARQWNLPESVVRAALQHHEPVLPALDSVATTQVACRLANLLGFSTNALARPENFDEATAVLTPCQRERLWRQLPELERSINEQIAFIDSPAALSRPLQRTGVALPEEPLTDLLDDFAPAHLTPGRHRLSVWLITTLFTLAATALLLAVHR